MSVAASRPTTRTVPHLRWLIAVLLLLLSVLNYVDRQALSVLATTIQADLGLSDTQYARVGQVFLLCYAMSYLAGGRIVDRIGPRIAETAFATWWSLANLGTAFVTGFGSLALVRGLLGLGESGHYTASAKVAGQWFPPKEKGIAVSLYTMGGTLGAAIAAPLVAWLTLCYGWRSTFIITGVAGLGFAAIWFWVYRPPQLHPWLGVREAALLGEHGLLDPARTSAKPTPISEMIRWKPLWLIMGVRMVTDPVWYFYLVWFAKYLQEIRQFTLADVGRTLWIVFVAADIGCLLAGWLSARLIRGGVAPVQARLRVMAGAAAVLGLSFMAPHGSAAWTLGCASLFAGCAMLFISSAVTLPLDLFPPSSLGSVQGFIGTGGSLGGMISTGVVAWLIGSYSYDTVFLLMSLLHPLAMTALFFLLPRFTRTLS